MTGTPAAGTAGLQVAVVVPAYNEQATVAEIVRRIHGAMPGATTLVIDDGSSDRTAAEARAAGARVGCLPFNAGIAYEEGFDAAVQVDGDGQHPPEQVPALLEVVADGGANYVIGSRFAERTGYRASLARRGGIAVFAGLVSRLVRQPLTDTTSGLRVVDRRALRVFAAHYPYDYPEVEAIVMARRAGLTVCEVPVHMNAREAGRSSITPLRSAYYMVKVSLAVLVQFMGRTPSPDEP